MTKKLKNPSSAAVSFILGVSSLMVWIIPLVGVPVALVGLILGVKQGIDKGEKGETGKITRWAIGLNSFGLALAVVHGLLGTLVN